MRNSPPPQKKKVFCHVIAVSVKEYNFFEGRRGRWLYGAMYFGT